MANYKQASLTGLSELDLRILLSALDIAKEKWTASDGKKSERIECNRKIREQVANLHYIAIQQESENDEDFDEQNDDNEEFEEGSSRSFRSSNPLDTAILTQH